MNDKVYPSTRYHRTAPPQRVETPEHELEVAHPDEGWAETPAAFEDDAPEPLPAKRRRG
jgi:hypothetical protein